MGSSLKYLRLFEDRLENLIRLHELGLTDAIDLSGSGIEELPAGLTRVRGSLILRGCAQLRGLPDGLEVGGSLYLEGCTALRSLPQGLQVGGSLFLTDCFRLRSLPDGLKVGHSLWLGGSGISATVSPFFDLPPDLQVGQQIFR
jgi:hypothetical protein